DVVLLQEAADVFCDATAAQAAVEDCPDSATPALRKFARIRENDAETAAHRIFQECGLAVPLSIDYENITGVGDDDDELLSWPVLKFSKWLSYLLDSGRLSRQLCGVPNLAAMQVLLEEFWTRWEALYPGHEVFKLARDKRLDLSMTIPVWSHSDEGRSQKQKPILVLSVHGCVGRGTQAYRQELARDPGRRAGMGLNFIGPTWSSQFLFSVMQREVYAKHPERFDGLAGCLADDLRKCWEEGVASSVNPELRVWAVHLGTKGDLPALTKIGKFEDRSYSRVPKTGQSKTLCKGICHLCHAAQESHDPQQNILFEDLGMNPKWASTLHQTVPWRSQPGILRGALLCRQEPADFFKLDLWHNFHMGTAKVWLASSFMLLCNLDLIVGNTIIAKFEALTSQYRAFCRSKRLSMHIVQFSRDTMGIDSDRTFPVGKWNKGAASTNLMLFLQCLCETLIVGKLADPLLLA
ncbi:unnamed protein product, partial [Symbiodinium sp. CCMP2456]